MSDELNREILQELKKLNAKLDRLQESKGLSTPLKLLALFFGFMVVGPAIAFLLSKLLGY